MLTGWRKTVSKFFIIPQRYVLALMGLLTYANAHTIRVCLNLAITQMVVPVTSSSDESSENYDPDSCPVDEVVAVIADNVTTTVVAAQDQLFEWSQATQGLLLSSFYYGYVITHIPGGILAQKFGGKWTLSLGLLLAAVATALTPLAVSWGGAPALFAIRVVQGLGEGPTTPCLLLIMARWVPPNERSIVGALVFGGGQLGNVMGSYISGLILADSNWPSVFYFFGGVGVIWFIFWTLLIYSTPNVHPFISDEEREYLNKHVKASIGKKLDPMPWRAILSSPAMWALAIGAIGHDWGYFSLMTDLPKYMVDVLKYNIKETGLLSSLPYIAMWACSIVFALICDFCIRRKWHSITTGRKLYTTISSLIPATAIIAASYAGCDRAVAVALFIICVGFMGGFYSSIKINAMDIAPNFAAATSSITNGIAAASGIVTPYLIGLLTPDSTLSQWRIAFWICFIVLGGSNVVYLIWGSGEQQWWDDVDKHGYPDSWKHGPLPTRTKDAEKSEKDGIEVPEKNDLPH